MRSVLSLIAARFRRLWLVMLGTAVLSTTIGALWWQFDLFSQSDEERSAYDDGIKKFSDKWWFPAGKVTTESDIVIIAITEKTFDSVAGFEPWRQRYGSWPYDRMIYADTFSYVRQCGAKLIAYDATMDEPKAEETGDLAFADSIRENGIAMYLGFGASPTSPPLPKVEQPVNRPMVTAPFSLASDDAGAAAEDEFPDEAELAAKQDALKRERPLKAAQAYAFPVEVRGGVELPVFTPDERSEFDDGGVGDAGRKVALYPKPAISPLLEVVSGFGSVIQEEDEDGKMRRTHFAYSDGINTYVTLPLAVAADVFHADKVIIEPGLLTIGERRIPIDHDGAAWLDYGGPMAKRFRSISIDDVLRHRARNDGCENFKDKYVFVGGFAIGTGDGNKATPLESSVPGVVKQVTTFENLIHGGFITDAPFWVSLLFSFLVCLFSSALVLIVRNTFIDIAWPVALWVGFFLLTGGFLTLTNIHVLSAMPGFAGTIASVLSTAWERLFANRERERLKDMFRSYMEGDLVDLMVEQRELPKLEGEVRNVTAFFSDIKGFSTFSERFRDDPQGLMRLLNRYLSVVTPVLRSHGACIDKYIGDAVVALFGAPVKHHDHALRACQGALAVQQAIGELRATLKAEGLPDVYTRIGLNTDDMLVGNIGSDDLLDYTAIGDGMNLAARLEATNKAYSTLILIGENTYLAVKDLVVAREVDQVRVAGKTQASRIYELVAMRGQASAAKVQVLALYAEALTSYRAKQFSVALTTLERALAIDPDDGPSHTLKGRCEKCLREPPPPEWDGVSNIEK